MLFGVFFLATIRYKKIPNFPKTIIPLFHGILTGVILFFTSPGLLSRILGTNKIITLSNNLQYLYKEVLPFSLILLSFTFVIYAILWHKKQLILSKNSEDDNEFIYRSLYLFLLWLGFILILYLGRIPYFRTLIIAATVLPLVYLIISGGSKLLDSITIPKYIIILPISIIIYSIYVTTHNINLMKNIINDYQKQIVIAQDTNTDLIVPVYDAPFKHIYLKSKNTYIQTSEMGNHANKGSAEKMQKDGMRVFFHPLSLNFTVLLWKSVFYNYTGVMDLTNQSITNTY